MRTVILNGACMTEREMAHDYLARLLEFPAYYGKNLDALYDCLTELDDTRIVVLGSGDPGEYLRKILRVLRDAQEENPGLTVVLR